jgi:hypothetical protein
VVASEFALLDHTTLDHKVWGYVFGRFETLIQIRNAYFNPFFLEDVCKTALGQSSLKGHLAAFKASSPGVTGS